MPKNNYVIIHGKLVEVSDEVLMHWKYIKREKKNGRWVYYYDQSELDKAKSDWDSARVDSWKAAAEYGNVKGDAQRAWDKKKATGDMDNTKYYDALSRESNAKNAMERARQKAESAEKKYTKKKISSFAARTLSKGAVKVANLLSKLFSKKK